MPNRPWEASFSPCFEGSLSFFPLNSALAILVELAHYHPRLMFLCAAQLLSPAKKKPRVADYSTSQGSFPALVATGTDSV